MRKGTSLFALLMVPGMAAGISAFTAPASASADRTESGALALTRSFHLTGGASALSFEFGGETAFIPFYVGAAASHGANADLAGMFSLSSATGSVVGQPPEVHFKSTLNAIFTGFGNTSSGWAFNAGCGLAATAGPVGCVGVESDINLLAAGAPAGLPPTASGPWRVAFAASGSGPGIAHAGYLANSSISLMMYGFAVTDYSGHGSSTVIKADFFTNSKSPKAIEIRGSHSYGLDLAGGTFGAATIRIPNNSAFAARNGADTADINIAYVSAGDYLVLGQGAISMLAGSSILPVSHNVQALGDDTHRFAQAWTSGLNFGPIDA